MAAWACALKCKIGDEMMRKTPLNCEEMMTDNDCVCKPMRGIRKSAECRAEWFIVGWTALYLGTITMETIVNMTLMFY